MRYCKTKITARKVPSLNDVANTKMNKIFDEIGHVIEEEDLGSIMHMIEERIYEEDYTAMDMAAALMKMMMGTNESVELPDYGEFGNTGAKDGMVRLFINIGKSQKVKPGDILGAIAGESGIPGRLVGTIDMYDKYTFVEVPQEHAREVMMAMKNTKIKGKSINIEPANHK